MTTIRIAYHTTVITLILTFSLLIISCGGDAGTKSSTDGIEVPDRVRVRLPADPERLNPMLSRSGYATQIEANIFMSLIDHHPESLELIPMLAESLPEITQDLERNGVLSNAYTYTIRQNAVWSDGQPVLASDFLFSVKAALNPYVTNSWRGFINFFVDVELDPEDDKTLTIFVNRDYMLSMEISGGFFIYPEHIYDPEGHMKSVSFNELKNYAEGLLSEDQEKSLTEFAELFSSSRFSNLVVEGSGPYRLNRYESGQVISLERKEDWWGNEYFFPGPQKIDYLIIADEAITLSALKDGTIDIAGEVPARYFNDLKKDKRLSGEFEFHTPPLFQMYYLALNNQHRILSDMNVRKAIAHLTDVDFMISEIMGGFGEPAPGVIHPGKEDFNPEIKLTPLDLIKADSLLTASGWMDTNRDGIRDKVIDGELVSLQLTMDVSAGEIGQQLALLLKESAVNVGLDIQIRNREFRLIREDLRKGNFDMTPLVIRQNLFRADLYSNWHSDALPPAGNNITFYSNPEADKIIEKIQVEKDEDQRRSLYFEIQELIHRDHPVVFLAAPKERVVIKSGLDVITSAKRPGYFEAMARLR